MPRQNRVTPFGELITTPHRGTLMGNRGCLHDAEQRIRHPFTLKRWIHCVLEFKGRRRAIMTPGRYTELFFLDEATALAAGHRPCAECQRERYRLFREHWAAASGIAGVPSADGMDDVLHAERLEAGRGKRTYTARLAQLPAGVMVADEAHAYLVLDGALLPWAPEGYGPRRSASAAAEMRVLTPRSIVDVIARGYPVGLHASALV
ncbi:MAG TPA: hypothetical protein VN646_05650 [Candidatus Acidoferrum sp.]|nr:hypothetical protein [Candidatus Acidoferrum sp.]